MEHVAEKLAEGPFFVEAWGSDNMYDVLIREDVDDNGHIYNYLVINAVPQRVAVSHCKRLNAAVRNWMEQNDA